MKKTQYIELFNGIGKTKVSFVAIAMFVLMSMALFIGIMHSGTVVLRSTDDIYRQSNMWDYQITDLEGGISSEDEFLGIDGIAVAETVYCIYDSMDVDGFFYEANVLTLSETVNKPINISGRLPSKEGEAAILASWAEKHDIGIGDTVRFKNAPLIAGVPESAVLTENVFLVTATLESADYLYLAEGAYGVSYPDGIPVNCVVFIDDSSVNKTVLPKGNRVLLGSDVSFDVSRFSDEYLREVGPIRRRLEEHTVDDKVFIASLPDNNSSQIAEYVTRVLMKLRFSIAGIFVIIGFMVCYFTVSRMVYESTTNIGTKKAVGFRSREIVTYYLTYVILASIIGILCGIAVGELIIKNIILTYVKRIVYLNFGYGLDVVSTVILALVEILAQTIPVLLSCATVLRKNALSLLAGNAPAKGKSRFYEKTRFWKKIPLLWKTAVNNFFNEKLRVFSIVTGIAGFSSLILCALSLYSNIAGSFDLHYEKVFEYDTAVYLAGEADIDGAETRLRDKGIECAKLYTETVFVDVPGETLPVSLAVLDEDRYGGLIHLHDVTGREPDLSSGAYLSCAYKEEYGMPDDATVTFGRVSGEEYGTRLAGFYEYYLLGNQMVMDKAFFEREFDYPHEENTLYFNRGNCTIRELNDVLASVDGFRCVSDEFRLNRSIFDIISALFVVVIIVYFTMAVAMGIFVLMNLFAMLIREKKRELLTLRVLGYSVGKAKYYLISDTIVLSIIGVGLGMLFGKVMGDFTIRSFFGEWLFLNSGFNPGANLLGILIAGALIYTVCAIVFGKIKKMKLTEINEK